MMIPTPSHNSDLTGLSGLSLHPYPGNEYSLSWL